jgi:MFS family permease
MLKGTFSKIFGITARIALTNILLITNALVWYYYTLAILQESIHKMALDYSATLLLWSIHFAGITFSALAGASSLKKLKERTTFLTIWMMSGVASSLTLMVVNIADVLGVLALSLIFGIAFAWGMPNCMGYYTANVRIENRGRLGGIILLFSLFGMFLLGITAVENIVLHALILAVWRFSGLAVFLLIKPPEKHMEENIDTTYRVIFSQRSFILYLTPWIMFSLAGYLILPVQSNVLGRSLIDFLMVIENVLGGIFAVVGGFILDTVGRKRVALAGFIMLGVSYSILGIYPESVFSWYFYTVVDGIAWGVLFVVFVITIWGDLSYGAPSDKYYAVGVLPFFISKFLQLIIGEYVAAMVPPYAIFSFTAFFLFLAVFPLMYAPETLPEKKIRERELRQYIEKAKKIREKYT